MTGRIDRTHGAGVDAMAQLAEIGESKPTSAPETQEAVTPAEINEFLLNRPRSTGFRADFLRGDLQGFSGDQNEESGSLATGLLSGLAPTVDALLTEGGTAPALANADEQVDSFVGGADGLAAASKPADGAAMLQQLRGMESKGKVPSLEHLRLLRRLATTAPASFKKWYKGASAKLIRKTFSLPPGKPSEAYLGLHDMVHGWVKALDGDFQRTANAKKIEAWTPKQLAKVVESSSHESLVKSLQLLASGSRTGAAYEKLLQAVKEYALKNHKGDAAGKVNDLAQEIIRMSGPGSGAVKGDFAAVLQTIIEAPGTKPAFPSFKELLTRLVRSAPGDVARILEDKSKANQYGKSMLTRVLKSVEEYDKKVLPEVLGAVGAHYAVASKRYADAEEAYTTALGGGNPQRIESAKRARDRAKASMVARGREFGFAYRSAELAVDGIAKDKTAEINRKAVVIQASLKIMSKVSEQLLPGAGKVVGRIVAPGADAMTSAQKRGVAAWQKQVKNGLRGIAENIYKTYVDGGVAGPDSERGRRSADREDAFQNQYEVGYRAAQPTG